MPHEVIMPALGMAQDTGLIVAWHKAAGDKVAPGDVLMEVETDKATMEVEAQAEGFLTNVRATEGEAVPVGNVIATISESPEEATEAPVEEQKPAAPAPAPVEGKSVIMPALGMAQDTGLLVAWRKAPGDAVSASDILLEVETDKSTMEVEAGHDGYIAELRAEAGENVPVGDVIAIITAEKPEAPVQRSAAAASAAPETNPVAEPKTKKQAESAPSPAPVAKTGAARMTASLEGGRILASPKAKRLAAERGMDLTRLAAAGHPQPYHVADLDRLAALSQHAASGMPAAAPVDRIEARVPGAGYAEFRDWYANETGGAIDDLAIWSAFAAASLRVAAGPNNASLVIEAQAPLLRQSRCYCDPDYFGLAGIAALDDDADPALIVRALTGSRITAVQHGGARAPSMTIADSADMLELVLDVPAGTLEPEAAITVVHEMAARLEEPLRHLL